MSKLSIIIKSIMITTGLVGIASASPLSPPTWGGFYVGGDAGVIFDKAQLKSQQLGFTSLNKHCNTSSDFSIFSPGIQLGYMHQFLNSFAAGIEAHIAFNTNQTETLSCVCPFNPEVSDSFSFRNQMQRAIKGRLGRSMSWNGSNILPYLTAGVSFANVELTYQNEGGDYYSKNKIPGGGLIGAGLEWALGQNWSFRAEYNYVDYGNAIKLKIPSVYGLIDPNGNGRINLSSNNLILSINYWFP